MPRKRKQALLTKRRSKGSLSKLDYALRGIKVLRAEQERLRKRIEKLESKRRPIGFHFEHIGGDGIEQSDPDG